MASAFLFPGQAAQQPGMMTDFIENEAVVRQSLERISDATSVDVAALCTSADETQLNDGRLSGLVVVASSVALYHLARENGLTADACAGYSVGQYAALYAAGMLSLDSMLAILMERQEALDSAAKNQASGMVAALGVPLSKVEEIVAEFEGAEISNYNCPNNYSVACHRHDAEALVDRFTKADAVRSLVLPVAGGWHSHFMLPAAEAIRSSLESLDLRTSDCVFVDNVCGLSLSDPSEIRASLFEHVHKAVQWEKSLHSLFELEISSFVELGYGDQLSKFVKFTDRRKQVFPTGTLQRFHQTLQAKEAGRIQ